jgi:uncharacterized repeat protein (TIGR03803 family)
LTQCGQRSAAPTGAYLPNAGVSDGPSVATYRIVHSFGKGTDGVTSQSPLINADGALFGTTIRGGKLNEGTIFRVTPAGAERVIHSFGGSSDSGGAAGGLIASGGKLYGASPSAIFSMTYAGAETVIYRFGSVLNDGSTPSGGVVAVNGKLYGVTLEGGKHFDGTVYSVSLSGSERILHSFAGGKDGRDPVASLTHLGNTFYGITQFGGVYDRGTVFSVTPSGVEHVLHSFGGGADGSIPIGTLCAYNGTLYGATEEGGTHNDNGVVFSITTGGNERVLYSFGASKADGVSPSAGLTAVNGVLYGTTILGGAFGSGEDGGTVFSVTPRGSERIVHSFGNGHDGQNPAAELLNLNGTLYGTTSGGGAYGPLDGTVFSLRP